MDIIVKIDGNICTTIPFKDYLQNYNWGAIKNMKIVGQVSSTEEAKEMESIVKAMVVGNRARILAERIRKVN